MRANDFFIRLGRPSLAGGGALYGRVAEALHGAMVAGIIRPGEVLPGIRPLAQGLGVHPNTVISALRELENQGWVTARPRSGFFVSDPLPGATANGDSGALGTGLAARPGFDIPASLATSTSDGTFAMDLTEGLADARLAPAAAMAQAHSRGLRLRGPELLRAGDFKGLPRLREALSAHLATRRGVVTDPDQILVLNSTAMAVTLVAQALLGAGGGHVAVENPGNPMVWDILRQACPMTLHGLPVDGQGVDPEALEALGARVPLGLLVLTPQCHFPTGAPLALDRKLRILEISRRLRIPILELDPEYDYLRETDGPPRPLAALDPGQVVYVGSLSRILAPGVRASYCAVPGPVADLLAKARQRADWQGDPAQEWALSELFADGEIQRQISRVRKAAQIRREALADALEHTLGASLAFDKEVGATALWLKGQGIFADPARFTIWVRVCVVRGMKLRRGAYYDLEGRDMARTRLGFTAYTPEELQQAVAAMV